MTNVDVLHTDESRFAGLPGALPPPRTVSTADGLRMAVVDEGPRDAPVVLLLHGEPTWSYLYRTMAPALLDAGLRVVAPDLIGFGRSDKPVDDAAHTYAGHVEWLRSVLFDGLDLADVTLFCQDWGGLFGLRLVAEQTERFAAVCASNTGLPDGSRPMGEEWQQFHAFVQATPDLPVGRLVAGGCATPPPPEVVAAYDAPFPTVEHKAGPRALPGLIPQAPDAPGASDNVRAWSVLGELDLPFLCAFSDGDPVTAGMDRVIRARVPGAEGQPHTTIAGAGHFVQEDAGPELARVLLDWRRF
ncbi:MAG: haloalkane dehalogenase [Phycicoccus sp.]